MHYVDIQEAKLRNHFESFLYVLFDFPSEFAYHISFFLFFFYWILSRKHCRFRDFIFLWTLIIEVK